MTSSATTVQYQSSVRSARVTFGRLVRAETIALYSLRATYVTLLIGGGLTLGITFMAALNWAPNPMSPPFSDTPRNGMFFAQIAAALLGASLYAGEHTSGSLRTQFAAAPRRVSIMLAKATTLFISIFVLGAVLVTLSLAAAAIVYAVSGHGIEIDASALVPLIVGGGAAFALTSVLGLGIAAILRSEALTITSVLVLLLVVPVLLTLASDQEWARILSELMFSQETTATMTKPIDVVGDILVRDVLVSIAWPAVALAIGTTAVVRRDA